MCAVMYQVCIYACVYVCRQICVCISTCIHTYIHTYIRTYIHTYNAMQYNTIHSVMLRYVTVRYISYRHTCLLKFLCVHINMYIYIYIDACEHVFLVSSYLFDAHQRPNVQATLGSSTGAPRQKRVSLRFCHLQGLGLAADLTP